MKAYRKGEVANVGKVPRLIFLKYICVCVCVARAYTCVHVHTRVNTTDCSVGRWLFYCLLTSAVIVRGNLVETKLVFGISPSSGLKCLFLSHMYLCFVKFGIDI